MITRFQVRLSLPLLAMLLALCLPVTACSQVLPVANGGTGSSTPPVTIINGIPCQLGGSCTIPTTAVTSSTNIQNQSGWFGVHDTGTPGSSSGTMAIVSSPSISGNARQFSTTFASNGGERYSIPFDIDAAATHFLFDGWIYVQSSGTAIGNMELDMNQVMSNGDTVIYGLQCDGGTGKWDYTQNTGTPSAYVDVWTASSVSCNPASWTTNTWHHVQFTYSRDGSGNVTYQTISFDGVLSTLNVTVNSAFTLGWTVGTLLVNFQMDGLGSGSNVLYLDSLTISRW